ncbi:MBL fold metallo-hydrolase [Candidatus Kaiserbacteria bacterium]|nr:MBL fold metallo-hydrolase [Candidatus Kaiserbacteria bacterium]
MSAKIIFYGGVGTVTGANFLLNTLAEQVGSPSGHSEQGKKILIDCGALQQEYLDQFDTVNAAQFPYDPKSIDVLIVTHAHADHIGRIPKLVKDGFRGIIYSTPPTKDLSEIMFDDAIGIMETKAEEVGCDLLYDHKDVELALSLWQGVDYHQRVSIDDFSFSLLDAGHILGSALVKLSRKGRVILFTGDLGNSPEPLLRDTESPEGANYIVMESVYGDRVHEGRTERRTHLLEIVDETRERGGVLIIPSFSIERTQVLLYELNAMVEDGAMASIPIYVDSPLAIRITEVFKRYAGLFNSAAQERIQDGDNLFACAGLKVVKNKSESEMIHRSPSPKIIIAGAGMSGGGRVRAHEKFYLGDRKATVLFVGYQAPGTLGRRIQDGEKKVRIDGEYIKVHARVETVSGYSGHADRNQLLDFVEKAGERLEKVFVVMGETGSSLFLAQRVKDFLGVESAVPQKGDEVILAW